MKKYWKLSSSDTSGRWEKLHEKTKRNNREEFAVISVVDDDAKHRSKWRERIGQSYLRKHTVIGETCEKMFRPINSESRKRPWWPSTLFERRIRRGSSWVLGF